MRTFRILDSVCVRRLPIRVSNCPTPTLLTSTPRSPYYPVHRLRDFSTTPLPQFRHRNSPSPYPPYSFTPRESAVDPLTVLLAIALSIGAGYVANKHFSSEIPSDKAALQVPEASTLPTETDMSGALPPGRPGNLTSDQEEKLRELWIATLDVFGVTHGRPSSSNQASAPSATHTDDKKKKSKLSIFSKKHKDGDHSADTTDDENDKHGQAKEFRQAIQNQSPESLRTAFWGMVKHDDPDALLLRFLRARKWDVQAALVMMISTLHWRAQEMHVDDDIVFNGEGGAVHTSRTVSNPQEKKDAEDFLVQMRMGKSFLHGLDAEGRPVCTVRARLHKAGEQTERSLEKFTVYTIDTARIMLRPPIDTATIVFDMTGFSMSNMDYTPVKFMIKCFEANYPESLGSVLVYKAPWVFQGIWKIIRGWLDPVVASKIHFASNVDELSEFIPRKNIPKDLGGDEDWEYKYVEPIEGENAKMKDTATRDSIEAERRLLVEKYQTETVGWAKGDNKGEERSQLRTQLLENYWKLDPYVRARTLYDRIGVIGRDGKMDFYPKAATTSDADLD